jgi:hypothetical protein
VLCKVFCLQKYLLITVHLGELKKIFSRLLNLMLIAVRIMLFVKLTIDD